MSAQGNPPASVSPPVESQCNGGGEEVPTTPSSTPDITHKKMDTMTTNNNTSERPPSNGALDFTAGDIQCKVPPLMKDRYTYRREDSASEVGRKFADMNGDMVDMDDLHNGDHSSIEKMQAMYQRGLGELEDDRDAFRDNGIHNIAASLARHRLGMMRNDSVSPETSKLLRGILQGKEKKLAEKMNSGTAQGGMVGEANFDDEEGMTRLDRGVMRNSSFDLDQDSLLSATPEDMSEVESDADTQPGDVNGDRGLSLLPDSSKYNKGADEGSNAGSLGEDSVEAKRARIDTILTSMRPSPTKSLSENGGGSESRRQKRKQYIPQQHDSGTNLENDSAEPCPKVRKMERDVLREQLKNMQHQLSVMQHRYIQLFDDEDPTSAMELAEIIGDRKANGIHGRPDLMKSPRINTDFSHLNKNGVVNFAETPNLDPSHFIKQASKLVKEQEYMAVKHHSPVAGDTPKDLQNLAKMLKTEISSSVGTLVDTIVSRFAEQTTAKTPQPIKEPKPEKAQTLPPNVVNITPENTHHQTQQQQQQQPQPQQQQPQPQQQQQLPEAFKPKLPKQSSSPVPQENRHEHNSQQKPQSQPRPKVTDKLMHMMDPHSHMRPFLELPRVGPHLFPPPPYFATQLPPPMQPLYAKEPEQTEALPLVVNTPKKKRTKVTDTRLSPRAARALLQDGPLGMDRSMDGSMDSRNHMSPHHHHRPPSRHDHYPSPLVPVTLPTSVAIPNPSLQHPDVLAMYSHGDHGHFMSEPQHHHHHHHHRPTSHSPLMGDQGSPNMAHTPQDGLPMSLSMKGDTDRYVDRLDRMDRMLDRSMDRRDLDSNLSGDSYYDSMNMISFFQKNDQNGFHDSMNLTSTLTPMHLRKAKLMFFYTRYPSSAILKIYFPDIKFNKNNTAQLVKWFSNFREFYCIQMEKYSRQAIAEGVKCPEDITVSTDSEIYRVLNLHYNRNNQIEVPENFRIVIQATLREFFKAIFAGKDQEQSWKKAIYKIIARMDDTIPEYFKSPNWMEQLSDM